MKNRRAKSQLLLLLLAFALPIIAAKILLSSGFRGEISTHGGELLAQEISYQSLALSNPTPGQWQMLYISNNGCDKQCYDKLGYLQQTWRALGRLQDRVAIVMLVNEHSNQPAPSFIDRKLVNKLQVESMADIPYQGQVIIVDPLGNLVMSFSWPDDQQQSLIVAHDILLDIKQLLKLSRIG